MRCNAGAKVARGGVYEVHHLGHRTPHRAILQAGESFPECRRCGTAVVFELAGPLSENSEAEHIGYDRDFMDSVLRGLARAG